MDFSQTMRACARRWYVAIPGFLLVVAISLFVADRMPHQYESTGTIVLTEPDPASAAKDHSLGPEAVANPLLSFADSLTTSSELLIQSLNSPIVAQQVEAKGGTATYMASDGALTGPFIVVTADAPQPDKVQDTVALAIAYVRQELVQRQKDLGAPAESFIVVKDVVTPTTAAPKLGGKTRFLGAVVILALAASLCATYGVETYRRRRRTLRPAR
ncbi:MAG TPA: hypothetical protein VFX16_04100 [Pseudonocardiaceae bacterium]|nr:hypothetical protein [Pseudonocardiaceae bacterium]